MPSPRPDAAVRLFVRRLGDDDPKVCTGRRLLRLGLAREPPASWARGRGPVLLDPYSPRPLGRWDRSVAERGGVLAIDCSWNRLSDAGRFDLDRGNRLLRRRLPWLLAANPQHFGRPTELNTAEALTAALWLLGETERARALIAPFPGGRGFVPLNADGLRDYGEAPDEEALRAAERRRFGGPSPTGTLDLPSEYARSGPSPGPRDA